MYFHGDHNLNMSAGNIKFDLSAVEFRINDMHGNLVTNFDLEDIDFNMGVRTDNPLVAQVYNDMHNFRFGNTKMLNEGSLYIDIR